LTGSAQFFTTGRMSLPIVPIGRLAIAFEPWSWPFADGRRAEIDAHFTRLRARSPQIWNGRVVLARNVRIADGGVTGACFETDFASFLAWRDWGFPEAEVTNCFAMGALRSADDAFLLGVMGAHTANAGRVYFPAGTPDPNDVVDGQLDLARSIMREVAEETGLTAADYAADPDWRAVPEGRRLAMIKALASPLPAAELQRRIRGHIAGETMPELADVRIVRGRGDLDPKMPAFVIAYLEHHFG